MEKLRSLFWSSVTMMALLGIVSSFAAPIAYASPIVKITQPGHEQVVQGVVVIDVSYRSDSDQPITRLDLLINGELARQHALAVPRTSGTQAFEWDFSSAAGSRFSLSARAVDAQGEIGMATISVTVAAAAQSGGASGQDRIPPLINIYYPAQGAELSGQVEIRAEATDNVGVKYVFFYIDGKLHKMIMNTGPYEDVWDTTRSADGPHVLQVTAMDEAENEGASAEVTIFVKNRDMTTAPSAALTSMPPAPTVGVQEPAAASAFGATEEPLMALATGAVDVTRSRVGYASPIADYTAEPRISLPGLGLEQIVPTSGEALAPEIVEEPALAAADVTPRLTMPRDIKPGSHVVMPIAGQSGPLAPEASATDTAPRMTMPRALVARVASAGAEEFVLEPVLEVTPDPEQMVALTTTPGATLIPAEMVIAEETPMETLVVSSEPETDIEPMVAALDGRMTQPDRMLVPATVAVAPEEVELSAAQTIADDGAQMRIALLPERASLEAIPADGRMTLPGRPVIAPVASTQFEDVTVFLNSEALDLLASPEFKDGISVAPLREIFEASDGVLYWYPVEKRVAASRPGTELSLTIGNPQVTVNDQTRVLEIAPYIKQGRTMVPLQFLADALDVTITFNPQTGQICLTSNEF